MSIETNYYNSSAFMIDNFQTVLHLANELQIMIIIWALHGVPYFIIQSYDDDDDDDDYSS